MEATIVDLRYHMKDVLRAIERGETVTVLYRGKAKAKLMPIETKASASGRMEDEPFFGMWKDHEGMDDPAAWVRSIRQPRPSLRRSSSPKGRSK